MQTHTLDELLVVYESLSVCSSWILDISGKPFVKDRYEKWTALRCHCWKQVLAEAESIERNTAESEYQLATKLFGRYPWLIKRCFPHWGTCVCSKLGSRSSGNVSLCHLHWSLWYMYTVYTCMTCGTFSDIWHLASNCGSQLLVTVACHRSGVKPRASWEMKYIWHHLAMTSWNS